MLAVELFGRSRQFSWECAGMSGLLHEEEKSKRINGENPDEERREMEMNLSV